MSSPSARPLKKSLLPAWFFPGFRRWVGRWPFFLRWPAVLAGWGLVLSLVVLLLFYFVYSSLALLYYLAELCKMPERS